jgi:hypothetical protein
MNEIELQEVDGGLWWATSLAEACLNGISCSFNFGSNASWTC